jgi:hypothetical protein
MWCSKLVPPLLCGNRVKTAKTLSRDLSRVGCAGSPDGLSIAIRSSSVRTDRGLVRTPCPATSSRQKASRDRSERQFRRLRAGLAMRSSRHVHSNGSRKPRRAFGPSRGNRTPQHSGQPNRQRFIETPGRVYTRCRKFQFCERHSSSNIKRDGTVRFDCVQQRP